MRNELLASFLAIIDNKIESPECVYVYIISFLGCDSIRAFRGKRKVTTNGNSFENHTA